MDFDTLNENQIKAVSWNDGPMLVLAGPGSGKTRVLTLRVARLIEENESAAVLALTFTNLAAVAMRAQVDRLLGRRADRVHLSTLHSFAAGILRQHGSHLGLRPDFSILTQDEDRLAVLKDAIEEVRDEDDQLPADRKGLLDFIDRLFAESYDGGATVIGLASTPNWVPLLYGRYCKILVSGNRLDFGSLLHFARRLLEEKPLVARALRLAWTHICVDEFQDTNKVQYDIIRLIAPTHRHNLFVVADDDQIIYQWNGASPERVESLKKDYELRTVQLPECYRCPAPIVTLANRLIVRNVGRVRGKSPITARSASHADSGAVRYEVFPSPDEEALFIGTDIRDRGLSRENCIVIGRTLRVIEDAAMALRKVGFEGLVVRRKSEFEAPSVRVLVEALRLANARHDRDILRRLCLAWRALDGAAIEPDIIAGAAALVGGDFLRAWADAGTVSVSETGREVLARIRSDLVEGLSFPAIVEWFLEGGWRTWSGDDDRATTEEEVSTWRTLDSEVRSEYGSGVSLNAYLMELDLASKNPHATESTVRFMTVHGAKGLGFKHVYLIGMAQSVFPSYHALRRGIESREVEEERRNCFVAITRVEETLTITRSTRYFGHVKMPSQFLDEMGLERAICA